ncbi:matrixin family metalloprotease [Candidatus Poribacteria bacterium]|nr:matrixin family metalloprotease [Candidatus Poribacteria bacterium]
MRNIVLLTLILGLTFTLNIQFEAVALIVKVVHFVPSDAEIPDNIDEDIDTSIKEAQEFFRRQMRRHGKFPKTFKVGKDENDEIHIHRVHGRFNALRYEHYSDLLDEIPKHLWPGDNVILVFLENPDFGDPPVTLFDSDICGVATDKLHIHQDTIYESVNSGIAVVVRDEKCALSIVVAHELGHAFGLSHYGESSNLMASFNSDVNINSKELDAWQTDWLDYVQYFNIQPTLGAIDFRVGGAPFIEMETQPWFEKNKIGFEFSFESVSLYYVQIISQHGLVFAYKQFEHGKDVFGIHIQKFNEEFTLPPIVAHHEYFIVKAMDRDGNYRIHKQLVPNNIPFIKGNLDALYLREDVNQDGKVDSQDLIVVASNYGINPDKNSTIKPDVNLDGVVDKKDLELVLKKMKDPGAAAPSLIKIKKTTTWGALKQK